MASDFEAKDARKGPIFIDRHLDDYGLSPVEFRCYARIARRAGSHSEHRESISNMAKAWGLNEKTVRRSIRVLVLTGLIEETKRPGQTSLYTLTDRDHWVPTSRLKSIRKSILSASETADTTSPGTADIRDRGTPDMMSPTPRTSETDEGTPSKVLPRSNNPSGVPLYRIEELKDPDCIPGLRNQMAVYEIDFDLVYKQFIGKYLPLGGIGRKKHEALPLDIYIVKFDAYCATFARNHKNGNGNGKSRETRSETNERYLDESLAYLRALPGASGLLDHQSAALLPAAELKPQRTGGNNGSMG